MREDIIPIIGHKNPDTDSICSAIAYASLKHAQGHMHYAAARCGNSNSRIDTVLQRFNMPLPPFIGDVTPRVHDIMKRDMRLVGAEATCADALEMIENHDLRALPVVRNTKELVGMVSIFNLGEFFIPKPGKQRDIRHVHSTINAIIHALKARVVNLVEPDRLEHLYVRVGAMDIRSFGGFLTKESTSPEESIIIVGDRWDIQQKAIQLGVRLLVITGDQEVDPQVLEMARERNISLIISPYDSATTAWVTRTATRLDPMIQTDLVTFHPDDTLAEVRRRLSQARAMAYMVVDDDKRLEGVFTNSDIVRPLNRKIVLVDHNELSQAVNGADQVEIVEIIDHHRLGNPPSSHPVLFYNLPVGSTCTIIAHLYRQEGLTPSAEVAGLMMAGLISDTLKLQSPTTTPTDETILRWLENLAKISRDELAELIFSSGSIIVSQKPEDVISSDCKIYEEHGVRFSVSQVEELGFDNFWEAQEALRASLEAYRETNHLDFSTLLVTDVRSQNSLLLLSGPPVLQDAFSYPHIEDDDVFDLPGIVSRKKQLIPHITELLSRIDLAAEVQGSRPPTVRALPIKREA